ncbi:hypothetical protein B0H17DRAFT_1135907 [Mycena rosella]|uniref:PH domain-containing protein n=1 Tax=Mycena rosella TaxID=1033263 RepID=A0AAD7DBY8_MYCRO|nr:hypothetical protein B0H17DRAFT_1135907 [Mycena rosella]
MFVQSPSLSRARPQALSCEQKSKPASSASMPRTRKEGTGPLQAHAVAKMVEGGKSGDGRGRREDEHECMHKLGWGESVDVSKSGSLADRGVTVAVRGQKQELYTRRWKVRWRPPVDTVGLWRPIADIMLHCSVMGLTTPDLILVEEDANGVVHQMQAFNTETAEQLNSWLSGFESQLRRCRT